MSQSSEVLKSLFQKYCKESGKLFIPRGDDNAIAESLVSFYETHHSLKVLDQCVSYYIKNSSDPILIYNFALESSKVRDHILEENDIKENFDNLVRQTKERMERFK